MPDHQLNPVYFKWNTTVHSLLDGFRAGANGKDLFSKPLNAIWFVACIAFLPSGRAQNVSSRVEQLCVVRTSSTFHSEISVSCLRFSHQCSKSAMQHAGRRSFYLFIYLFIIFFFGFLSFPFPFLMATSLSIKSPIH